MKDLSRQLLVITATRASEGLIHNRKGVLPYQRQDRSAEQLESALEEQASWWLRAQVPYVPPKDMTNEQLHILIKAMVSRGYEAAAEAAGPHQEAGRREYCLASLYAHSLIAHTG